MEEWWVRSYDFHDIFFVFNHHNADGLVLFVFEVFDIFNLVDFEGWHCVQGAILFFEPHDFSVGFVAVWDIAVPKFQFFHI